jgi:hypothetical protein
LNAHRVAPRERTNVIPTIWNKPTWIRASIDALFFKRDLNQIPADYFGASRSNNLKIGWCWPQSRGRVLATARVGSIPAIGPALMPISYRHCNPAKNFSSFNFLADLFQQALRISGDER